MSKKQQADILKLENVTSNELAQVLRGLVEEGRVSEKEVYKRCYLICVKTQQKALKASKVDESEVDGKNPKVLTTELKEKLLRVLEERFNSHEYRHIGMKWPKVAKRIQEASPEKLWSLNEMERTGGEPDVVALNKKTGHFKFEDRSPESPVYRGNRVYNKAAEDYLIRTHQAGRCVGNAVDMAAAMGIEILNEAEYRAAQKVDILDKSSSSWVNTPVDIIRSRRLIALVGNRDRDVISVSNYYRKGHFFNRGFRGSLWV